jgi:predicted nicotinamide N-methyase
MDEKVNSPNLTGLLRTHLPFARAEHTPVPGCGELALFLLNADFAQHELSPEQVRAVADYPAYWAFCWASGQVLARFLCDNPAWVAGKRVLDFGAGSGVAGIAAGLAGASAVVACDIDPDARQAALDNAALNGVALTVCADFDACEGDFDVILAADVLYDRANLAWLDRFLARAGTVLVADSRVRDFSHPAYTRLGQWESCTLPDLDESAEFRRVSLYAAGSRP